MTGLKINVCGRSKNRTRSLQSPGVRPSVCPSRSCIVSRWLKISSNFFLGPVAPSFQFTDPEPWYPIPNEPLQRGRQIHRGICDFRLKSPFISATVRDRPMVATER